MDNFEQFVTEEVTENVEQTTEQNEEVVEQQEERKFTQAEVNEMIRKNVSRNEAKLRKQFERDSQKYRDLEDVLRAGTGEDTVEGMTGTFRDFYEKKGIQIPKRQAYSEKDIETLAIADANEIIGLGYEEVVEEVDRLTQKGFANMDAREKRLFKQLAEYRKSAEATRELAKIGVTEDVYNSKEFQTFAAQFNSNTPITDVYNIYNQTKPRKPVQTMGSMKNGQEPKVKDFYTPEEIERLTDEDLDNEDVWNAVRRSMTGR